MAETLAEVRIEPVSPALGAEVTGPSLGEIAADAGLTARIREALNRHKVLFFRDAHPTSAEHVAFARAFGELEVHPVLPHHAEHPELVLLERGARRAANENVYHADTTWRECPSMGSILHCIECPRSGGDTIWVNMALAYERLPARVKAMLDGLRAMHDISHAFGGEGEPAYRDGLRRQYPAQEHPVVITHPETGERILYVNQGFTTHFANFTAHRERQIGQDFSLEANALMNYLMSQAAIPEFQVRLRWQPGTVAFWDNRATQHYAVQDYFPATRRMMRATVVGGRPA